MIDKEAQKISFRLRVEKGKYKKIGIAAVAAVAGTALFMNFYTGWFGIPCSEYMYYIDRGSMVENSWIDSPPGKMRTDENGRRIIGVCDVDGKTYVFSKNGVIEKGWADTKKGKMLLSDTGEAAKGWAKSDGRWYFFDKNGVMQTGWVQTDDGRFYLGIDGVRRNGWQDIDGKKYFFSADGVMQTGWVNDDGKWFYFSQDGDMQTGEQKIDGKIYLLGMDGVMQTGWHDTEKGKKYYYDDGHAAVSKSTIDGKNYYFDKEGIMQTSFVEVDGEKYFFGEEGFAQPGWTQSGDDEFYVCSDGYILDTEKETGNYGRLVIHEQGIDVKLVSTKTRDDYQSIVDDEESAVVIRERKDKEPVVADRRSQGFDMDKVNEDDFAYLIDSDGDIHTYVCTGKSVGENKGYDIIDNDDDTSIWKKNADGFCTYSKSGNSNPDEVTIAYWAPCDV